MVMIQEVKEISELERRNHGILEYSDDEECRCQRDRPEEEHLCLHGHSHGPLAVASTSGARSIFDDTERKKCTTLKGSVEVTRASIKVCGLSVGQFKHSIRPHLPKFPRLPDRVPCIFSTSHTSAQSEIYFPISRQSYRVDIDLSGYRVAGHSIPQRGSWLVLVDGHHVMFFDGRRSISLSVLPFELTGHLTASFVGDPDVGCEVLLVEIRDHLCISHVFDPVLNGWSVAHHAVDLHPQMPTGQVTTSRGFSWVDIFSSRLYSFDDFWTTLDDPPPTFVNLEEDLVRGADMICSIVYEEQLHAFVVFKDERFRVYRLGDRVVIDMMPTQLLTPFQFLPGDNIFASSYGPGLLTSARIPHGIYGLNRRIYLGAWDEGECVEIDGDEDPVVMKQCNHLVDGRCHCRSCVLLLDEYSLFRLQF